MSSKTSLTEVRGTTVRKRNPTPQTSNSISTAHTSRHTAFRSAGFTLLELVISCAILISIFAFAATSLTRIHRLRAESESRTRIIAEGRAIIDRIADELAFARPDSFHFIAESGDSTDIDDLRDTSSRRLAFIRYVPYRRTATRDDSGDTLPYVYRSIGVPNPNMAFAITTAPPRDSVTYSNIEEIIEYSVITNGHIVVTNAVAGEIMGTHTHSAAKGDTVTIPVTSDFARETRNVRTDMGAFLDIFTPQPETNTVVGTDFSTTNAISSAESTSTNAVDIMDNPSTNSVTDVSVPTNNIIVCYVVFTNSFSTHNTYTIFRQKAMSWPDPSSTHATLSQFLESFSSISATTNGPFPSVQTRYPTEDADTADKDMEDQTEEYLPYSSNLYTDIVSVTDTNDFAISGIQSTTGLSNAVNGSAQTVTNFTAALTNGFVNLLCGNNINRIEDYWTIRSPENTKRYDLPSLPTWIEELTPDNSYLTNRVAIDGYSYRTSLDDFMQFDFARDFPQQFESFKLREPPSVAFHNDFHAYDNIGGPNATNTIPLSLHQDITITASDHPGSTDCSLSSSAYAVGCESNLNPIAAQSITRETIIDTTTDVSPTAISVSITKHYRIISQFLLTNSVPVSIVATNSYHYHSSSTNAVEHISGGKDTRYETIVLDKDFEGSDDETAGIWLVESHDIPDSQLSAHSSSRAVPYAENKQLWTTESKNTSILYNSIFSISIVPLCFSTNENDRLSLDVWSPSRHPDNPPVCADVTLELMDPKLQSRFESLPDESSNEQLYLRQTIRLSRRIPIGTARRDLP